MPWKILWVVGGGSATLAAGALPLLMGVPLPWAVAAAVLAALLAMTLAGQSVRHCELFDDLLDEQVGRIALMVQLTILLHLAWIITLQVQSDRWMALVGVLVCLAAAEYGFAEVHEWLTERKNRKRHRGDRPVDTEGRPLDHVSGNLVASLHDIGKGRAELVEYRHIMEGEGD